MSSSELSFGRSPSLYQAEGMGIRSGVELTPEQVVMYQDLRETPLAGPLESDQVLMAKVLEQTGGPVDLFKDAYPHIFSKP